MKSAPIANAAAAASRQPIPPPAPTRMRIPVSWAILSRRAMITGSSTGMWRLSVWPPESASTATSSHIVTVGASACSAVTRPCLSSFATMSAGGGRIASSASSVRDTLKITLLRAIVVPPGPRSRPATR